MHRSNKLPVAVHLACILAVTFDRMSVQGRQGRPAMCLAAILQPGGPEAAAEDGEGDAERRICGGGVVCDGFWLPPQSTAVTF